MEKAEINFRDNIYTASTGEVFQAKINQCSPGTIFIVYSVEGAQVTLEVLSKISTTAGLVRVNQIVWPDGELEWYEDVMIEPENHAKPLKEMTKKELTQFVKDHDLDVDTKLAKAKLLAEIKKAL